MEQPLLADGWEHTNGREYLSSQTGETIYEDELGSDADDSVFLEYRQSLEKKPWISRPSIISIAIVICIYGIAVAAATPSKVSLFYKLSCHAISDKNGICDPIQTQVVFATLSLITEVVGNIVSIFSLGILGELSDKYGRKPFFIAFSIALMSGEMIRFFSLIQYDYLNYWLLVPAIVILNLLGGPRAVNAFASAYINDFCNPEDKIAYMSYIGAALAVGQLVGTLLSKFILLYFGIHPNAVQPTLKFSNEFYPLVVEIVLLALLTIYCMFILPESRNEKSMRKSRRFTILTPIDESSSSYSKFIQHLKKMFKPLRILTLPNELISYPHNHTVIRTSFMILVSIGLTTAIVNASTSAVFLQYAMLAFELLAVDISNLMLLITIAAIFAMGIFTPFLSNYVFPKILRFKVLKNQIDLIDYWVMVLGILFGMTGTSLLFTSNSVSGIEMAIVGIVFGSIVDAPTTSSLLKFIPESKTGEFFAATTLLHNTLLVVTPILTQSFYQFMLLRNSVRQIFLFFVAILGVCLLGLAVIKRLLHLSKATTDNSLNYSVR